MCQNREAKFEIDTLNRIDQIINRANENRNNELCDQLRCSTSFRTFVLQAQIHEIEFIKISTKHNSMRNDRN